MRIWFISSRPSSHLAKGLERLLAVEVHIEAGPEGSIEGPGAALCALARDQEPVVGIDGREHPAAAVRAGAGGHCPAAEVLEVFDSGVSEGVPVQEFGAWNMATVP